MTTADCARKYMDILALGLSIVNTFPAAYNQIFAVQNFESITEEIRTRMDLGWCEDNIKFINNIETILQSIKNENHIERKIVMAWEFCRWLDFKITYSRIENNENGERKFFSLYSLIPLSSNNYVEIESMNTNWEETGIWINPKFGIALPYVVRGNENIKKKLANRDAFEGINGSLQNCSYLLWDNKNKVKNIIISNDFLSEKENNHLRIAFSPMSDRADLVETEKKTVERNGMKMNGVSVSDIKNKRGLLERLQNDWVLASDNQTDIFFAPELLGTELSESNDGFYNDVLWKCSNHRLGNGEAVPKLTIFPSYWHIQRNTATIIGQDGRILARQEKHIPFVDIKQNEMEALEELSEWSTVLIHVPGIHRIAIMICAEFLAKEVQRLQEFICGRLGATLIIVPSYSRGEQDFINSLPSLESYGTTVIWGNCCGAIHGSEKAIGGCGIAGTKKTIIFGSYCRCGCSCENVEACIFLVDIPLDFEIKKTEELVYDRFVTHIIK